MIDHDRSPTMTLAASEAGRRNRSALLHKCIEKGVTWGRQAMLSLVAAGLLTACETGEIRSLQSSEAAAARDSLAASLVAGGNRNAAIRLYQGLAEDYPFDPDPILKLGDIYLKSNDLMLAEAAYDQARGRGGSLGSKLGHGRLALARNEPEEAIAVFTEVLADDAESFQALNGLGVAYDLQGAHGKAQESYARAIEILPSSRAATNNLALSLALSNEFDRALSIMQRLAAAPGASEQERLNLALIDAFTSRGDSWPLTPGQSKENHGRFLDFWFAPNPSRAQ